jgi:hypothetical protein
MRHAWDGRLSLGLAVAVSAALTIGLPLASARLAWLGYVFTPLTMVLILAIALTTPPSQPARYRWGVVAGLVFSLGGDVLLMLPHDLFLAGLSSFLVAQVCYVTAFTSDSRFADPGPGALLRSPMADRDFRSFPASNPEPDMNTSTPSANPDVAAPRQSAAITIGGSLRRSSATPLRVGGPKREWLPGVLSNPRLARDPGHALARSG